MRQGTYDVKGIYIEALTAEIFKVISGIIPESTKDIDFLKAQEKVRAIIAREYVEKDEQK